MGLWSLDAALSHPLGIVEHMFGNQTQGSPMTPRVDSTTTTSNGAVATAAEWAALSYRVEGIDAQVESLYAAAEAPEVRLVVVASLRRVECVVHDESDFDAVARELARELDQLRRSGWGVWVLAPLRRLGDAHIAFRGEADFLQGWWVRGDRSVTFTAPQIP